MAITPDDVVNPRLPAVRQKAYRLRKAVDAGQPVEPEDVAFLAAYESATSNTSVGASRNKRRIEVEEESMSVGTGDAALIAASAAQAREEGKRIDTLLNAVITGLTKASEMYRECAATALSIMKETHNRNEKLEAAHVKMFETMRENQLARVDAEMDLIAAERDSEEKPDITEDVTRGFIEAMQSHLTGGGQTKKS